MANEKHTYDVYGQPELAFVRGAGTRLYDANDVEYLDMTSGIAVNALGHGHPHMTSELQKAAEGIWHISNVFKIPGQERLAARLCEMCFADRVFFTNSGAEAMECAIKTARRFHYANGKPERINIITFEGAFHGRTIATIAAGGQEKYLEGFGPKAPGFVQLPFGDMDALKSAIDDETAALLIEPVQGEGGVRPVEPSFLKAMRELCDEHGILLIFDEIQTGIGRTGRLFAHQWYDVEPDIMAIAKAIGGGFPLGACLAREDIASAMQAGTHGSTYGGNPLAMAMGNAVLEVVLEDGFLDAVNDKALRLWQNLAELVDSYPELFESVHGKGLLVGLTAKVLNTDVMAAMRDEGLLVAVAGNNVVRLLPPLIISDEDLSLAREKMMAACDKLQNS